MSSISPLFALDAEELLEQGKFAEAVELCEQGIKVYPDYPIAYSVLSRAYAAMGEQNKAIETVTSAAEYFPNSNSIRIVKDEIAYGKLGASSTEDYFPENAFNTNSNPEILISEELMESVDKPLQVDEFQSAIDLSDFDFGEDESDIDSETTVSPIVEKTPEQEFKSAIDLTDFDFGEDDSSDIIDTNDTPIVEKTPEQEFKSAIDLTDFDFGEDDSSDTIPAIDTPIVEKTPEQEFKSAIDLTDFDFGEDDSSDIIDTNDTAVDDIIFNVDPINEPLISLDVEEDNTETVLIPEESAADNQKIQPMHFDESMVDSRMIQVVLNKIEQDRKAEITFNRNDNGFIKVLAMLNPICDLPTEFKSSRINSVPGLEDLIVHFEEDDFMIDPIVNLPKGAYSAQYSSKSNLMGKDFELAGLAKKVESARISPAPEYDDDEFEDKAENKTFTETMAKILTMQGRKSEAIKIYHKLAESEPDKYDYYISKAEEIG